VSTLFALTCCMLLGRLAWLLAFLASRGLWQLAWLVMVLDGAALLYATLFLAYARAHVR
jgi:hypothetical protein